MQYPPPSRMHRSPAAQASNDLLNSPPLPPPQRNSSKNDNSGSNTNAAAAAITHKGASSRSVSPLSTASSCKNHRHTSSTSFPTEQTEKSGRRAEAAGYAAPLIPEQPFVRSTSPDALPIHLSTIVSPAASAAALRASRVGSATSVSEWAVGASSPAETTSSRRRVPSTSSSSARSSSVAFTNGDRNGGRDSAHPAWRSRASPVQHHPLLPPSQQQQQQQDVPQSLDSHRKGASSSLHCDPSNVASPFSSTPPVQGFYNKALYVRPQPDSTSISSSSSEEDTQEGVLVAAAAAAPRTVATSGRRRRPTNSPRPGRFTTVSDVDSYQVEDATLASEQHDAPSRKSSTGADIAAYAAASTGGAARIHAHDDASGEEDFDRSASEAATEEDGYNVSIVVASASSFKPQAAAGAAGIRISPAAGEWNLPRIQQRILAARLQAEVHRHYTSAMGILLSVQMSLDEDYQEGIRVSDRSGGSADAANSSASARLALEQRSYYADLVGRELQYVTSLWMTKLQSSELRSPTAAASGHADSSAFRSLPVASVAAPTSPSLSVAERQTSAQRLTSSSTRSVTRRTESVEGMHAGAHSPSARVASLPSQQPWSDGRGRPSSARRRTSAPTSRAPIPTAAEEGAGPASGAPTGAYTTAEEEKVNEDEETSQRHSSRQTSNAPESHIAEKIRGGTAPHASSAARQLHGHNSGVSMRRSRCHHPQQRKTPSRLRHCKMDAVEFDGEEAQDLPWLRDDVALGGGSHGPFGTDCASETCCSAETTQSSLDNEVPTTTYFSASGRVIDAPLQRQQRQAQWARGRRSSSPNRWTPAEVASNRLAHHRLLASAEEGKAVESSWVVYAMDVGRVRRPTSSRSSSRADLQMGPRPTGGDDEASVARLTTRVAMLQVGVPTQSSDLVATSSAPHKTAEKRDQEVLRQALERDMKRTHNAFPHLHTPHDQQQSSFSSLLSDPPPTTVFTPLTDCTLNGVVRRPPPALVSSPPPPPVSRTPSSPATLRTGSPVGKPPCAPRPHSLLSPLLGEATRLQPSPLTQPARPQAEGAQPEEQERAVLPVFMHNKYAFRESRPFLSPRSTPSSSTTTSDTATSLSSELRNLQEHQQEQQQPRRSSHSTCLYEYRTTVDTNDQPRRRTNPSPDTAPRIFSPTSPTWSSSGGDFYLLQQPLFQTWNAVHEEPRYPPLRDAAVSTYPTLANETATAHISDNSPTASSPPHSPEHLEDAHDTANTNNTAPAAAPAPNPRSSLCSSTTENSTPSDTNTAQSTSTGTLKHKTNTPTCPPTRTCASTQVTPPLSPATLPVRRSIAARKSVALPAGGADPLSHSLLEAQSGLDDNVRRVNEGVQFGNPPLEEVKFSLGRRSCDSTLNGSLRQLFDCRLDDVVRGLCDAEGSVGYGASGEGSSSSVGPPVRHRFVFSGDVAQWWLDDEGNHVGNYYNTYRRVEPPSVVRDLKWCGCPVQNLRTTDVSACGEQEDFDRGLTRLLLTSTAHSLESSGGKCSTLSRPPSATRTVPSMLRFTVAPADSSSESTALVVALPPKEQLRARRLQQQQQGRQKEEDSPIVVMPCGCRPDVHAAMSEPMMKDAATHQSRSRIPVKDALWFLRNAPSEGDLLSETRRASPLPSRPATAGFTSTLPDPFFTPRPPSLGHGGRRGGGSLLSLSRPSTATSFPGGRIMGGAQAGSAGASPFRGHLRTEKRQFSW